jgi:hypothetical protein
MLAKPEAAAANPSHRFLPIAVWSALLLSVVLLAALGLARTAPASALPASPIAAPPAALPAFEDEEECGLDEPECGEELGLEECEESEDGEEVECEEVVEEEIENGVPTDCLLTSAKPRVSVASGQQRLRLDVRYDITAPAEVSVSLRSLGGKGSVTMPPQRQRLSRDGSFHEILELSEEEAERALSARQFTVRLRVAGVPSSCQRFESHHLTVKRGGDDSPVFS